MTLSDKTIADLFKLAHIAPAEGDLERYKNDLNHMLNYIERLKSIDTEGVEPLLHVGLEQTPRRDDVAHEVLGKKAIEGAARVIDDQVQVPKVIG